jgi:hypothetical protein
MATAWSRPSSRFWLSEEGFEWASRSRSLYAHAARRRAQHLRELARARARRRRGLVLLAAGLLGLPSLAAGMWAGGLSEDYEVRPFAVPASHATDWESPGSGAEVPAVLRDIARCESRGNPTAVSPDGVYRGKYQFDFATWTEVGGQGDPAAAPERRQDRLASRLYRERGDAPWPVCSA